MPRTGDEGILGTRHDATKIIERARDDVPLLLTPSRENRATMTADVRYEILHYAATLARLGQLEGREVLAELRVGDVHGPFRLAARGVMVGTPPGQAALTGRRPPGDDVEAFRLDNGGFLAVREADFVRGEWHAGDDEAQVPSQPHLNVVFSDSVLHVAVLWRHDAATGWPA